VIARSRIPIVIGASNPSFAAMRRLAREVMEAGAAGVMLVPASHLRSDEQIATYFQHAFKAIGPDVP
jgi:4-hydroxy-tetrahydrodipicolinate synthase